MSHYGKMSKIIENLYLSGEQVASNKDLLHQNSITHIVNVTSDIPEYFPSAFKYFTIPIIDWGDQNLLEHFDEVFPFIDEGIAQGSVLVHCALGVSRSPSVIIGYLISRHSMSYQDAMQLVATLRPIIGPNDGFLRQLQLFEKMGCTIDEGHPDYKRFTKEITSTKKNTKYKKDSLLIPDSVLEKNTDISNEIPLTSPYKNPSDVTSVSPIIKGPKAYLCRMCRTPLFVESHLNSHSGDSNHSFEKKKKNQQKSLPDCTSYFVVENLLWMELSDKVEGKLSCPVCNYRVGSWNWAGMQCSCGNWVSPAFQFVKSKVDDMVVKDIEGLKQGIDSGASNLKDFK